MRVPKDPNLYLTIFTAIGVGVVLVFWLLTPVYTPHLEEEAGHGGSVKPEQALATVDATLQAAEKTLADMGEGEGKAEVKSVEEKGKTKKTIAVKKPIGHTEHSMTNQGRKSGESLHSHDGGGDHGH